MNRKWLPTLVFGLSLGMIGCGGSTSGTPEGSGGSAASSGGTSGGATGGTSTGGSASGGSTATGGSSSGGTSSGGHASGGSSTGGTASGGHASGGSAAGGSATGGTATGGAAGGATGGGGKGSGGAAGGSTGGPGGGSASSGGAGGAVAIGNAPVPSKGCGMTDGQKKITMGGSSVPMGLATSTVLNITSGGMKREYVIDIPANYDPTHPHRLIFSWHQVGGSDIDNAYGLHPAGGGNNFDAQHYAFFGLRREADAANTPVIIVAPNGIGGTPWDYTRDVVLFDDLLALVDANLCIDDSRVFTTGFSFGAMMSYALSVTRQTKLRAAVVMSGVEYNLPGEPKDSNAAPIAYMGTNGMSDTTCPWDNKSGKGGKYCALTHAMDNGCTIPSGNNIPTTTVGSKKYVCYDFMGCKAGYPVKACTFDGGHTPSSVDDGSSTADDGLKAFIPGLAWQFISQF